jgi:hypothetical protein
VRERESGREGERESGREREDLEESAPRRRKVQPRQVSHEALPRQGVGERDRERQRERDSREREKVRRERERGRERTWRNQRIDELWSSLARCSDRVWERESVCESARKDVAGERREGEVQLLQLIRLLQPPIGVIRLLQPSGSAGVLGCAGALVPLRYILRILPVFLLLLRNPGALLLLLEQGLDRLKQLQQQPLCTEGRCKATWKSELRFSWREAGPPNYLDDKVDSDQQLSKKKSLCPLITRGHK